ncbi:MAG: ATP-binding cassette domain-containing protein [Rhodobiaceae bacterium]|nr:ATP-binding cassette domain-containing protein [Rhodobiaceae bacterium]MBT6222419.1 ATP-binding cassette domain-containing protein [Rhodobiaceae bacterium]
MTKNNIIELINIHKSFGSKIILNDLNLKIKKGSSTVVVGGSGTGKSVMLKCILGLTNPDSGTLLYKDQELNEKSRISSKFYTKIGMLFQGSALFDSLTVWENVCFGLVQGHGMQISEAKEISMKNLKKVGLDANIANLSPSELSGGMQKRVALARAIAANPEIIFFDEPTTGLDPIMADVINNLIIELVGDLGATAITITHDMASARKISDTIAMLYDGSIIWQGETNSIDSSDNDYVDQFINGRADGPIKLNIYE